MTECNALFLTFAVAMLTGALALFLPAISVRWRHLISHRFEPYWGWEMRPQYLLVAAVISLLIVPVAFRLTLNKTVPVYACNEGKAKTSVAFICRVTSGKS